VLNIATYWNIRIISLGFGVFNHVSRSELGAYPTKMNSMNIMIGFVSEKTYWKGVVQVGEVLGMCQLQVKCTEVKTRKPYDGAG
jgi:spore maturation protein SpmA